MASVVGVPCPYELLGASPAVADAVAQVERAAADDRGVLITAEPGLDAEAVARAIHQRSQRRAQPFVALACDGASAAALEKQLIGPHQGRAAELDTIAQTSVLHRAAGGTLYLAGVNEMAAPLQRRLARLLRDGEVRVARRSAPVTIDVRVIASVEDRLDAGLREELLRRLPLTVEVPALRQRREDVQTIAEAMLASRHERRGFTPAALTVLAALPWRRNTAELGGLIQRLVAGGGSSAQPIRQEDVLAEVQLDRAPARPTGSLRDARRQFEREFIASVLRDHSWHMREAARALGIERANLYRKARQLGIPLRREGTVERRISG